MAEPIVATPGITDPTTAAWPANVKALFDAHLEDVQQDKVSAKGWAGLALRQAEANHNLITQLAQNAVTQANLVNSNAASLAQLMNSSAVQQVSRDQGANSFWEGLLKASGLSQQTANNSMSNKLADQFEGTVTKALDAAIAASAQGNPQVQGTTGVAQGTTQAMTATANSAMMSELAGMIAALQAQQVKLAEVVGVLLVRVTGEEVKPLTPPASS